MKARKSSLVAFAAAALLAPTLTMAGSEWHLANNNHGFTYHPEHAKSSLSRAQVQGEARSAEPSQLIREGAPLDTLPEAAPGKTREQVRNERLSMSADERQRLQPLVQGG